MDFFTHLIPGILIFLAKSDMTYFQLVFLLLGCTIPDLDHFFGFLFMEVTHTWSKAERKLKGVQKVFFFPRTFVHSVWGVAFFSAAIYFFYGFEFVPYFAIGFLIHLILDSLDEAGIRWFFPKGWVHWKWPASYLQDRKYVRVYRLQKILLSVSFILISLLFLKIFL